MKVHGRRVNEALMTITVEEVDVEGHDEAIDIDLPVRFEVCFHCRGKGKHTNPSIDGNGITSSEWAEWDEDDRETYLSGGYDMTCEECGGARVIAVVDERSCQSSEAKAALELLEEEEANERSWRAESAYERRMMGGDY